MHPQAPELGCTVYERSDQTHELSTENKPDIKKEIKD
jgi:hypothetical protein